MQALLCRIWMAPRIGERQRQFAIGQNWNGMQAPV